MADPIIFTQQPGGVPTQSVLGVIPFAATQKTVPLDNTSNAIQAPIVFNAPSPGQPVLEPSFIDFLKTITDAIKAHKESNQNANEAEVGMSAKAYANFITGADAAYALIEELIVEAKAQSAAVQKIQDDVSTAYTNFTNAITTYNTSITGVQVDDANALDAVNAKITFLNSFQGLTTADYNTQIAANGGQAATLANINAGFTAWNSYIGTRNPQVAVLQANMESAIDTWKNAILDANVKIGEINTQRANKNLSPPVSLYPDPTTTYTTSFPAAFTTITLISGSVGPDRTPPMPLKLAQAAGQVTVVTLLSLALASVPKIADVLTTEVYISATAQLQFLSFIADILTILFADIFTNMFDQSLKGHKSLLPDAYIDKADKIIVNATGSGTGIGQVGRPEFDRVVPVALWKSIFEKASFPASSRLISTFQLAALGILDKSALAAAIPAASAFGSKLGSISELSPVFAAILASSIADNTLATTASNPARELANILLKNVVGVASGEGITFGELGTPSAGEIAEISGSLSAAFNIALLGTTLAMLEKSLGLPNLALQVLANVEGLTPADLIGASIAGSNLDEAGLKKDLIEQFLKQGFSPEDANLLANEALEIIKADVGIPGLNLPVPNVIDEGKAASDLLNTVLGINAAQIEASDRILQQFRLDREKIASIIKESILAFIRSGKPEINRELRNNAVAELRSAGYALSPSLYLANQLINQITGNPLSPVTGITDDRLEQLKVADKNITQSDITEALGKGPFSSELAFANALRGVLERSGRGADFDKALVGISDIKILNIEELHATLSLHLTHALAGLGGANAREASDRILIALLGGATPKEAADVDHRNPLSLINQVSDQLAQIKKDAIKDEEIKIHDRFLEVMQAYITPNAQLGYAISTMQDKPTTVLNSISGAVQAVAQTDILMG